MTNTVEKRKYPRVRCQLPAFVVKQGSDKRWGAEVLDLSEGGARLSGNIPGTDLGDKLTLTIKFGEVMLQFNAQVSEFGSGINQEFSQSATVRWAAEDGSGTLGVQFGPLVDLDRRVLLAMIEQLKVQE